MWTVAAVSEQANRRQMGVVEIMASPLRDHFKLCMEEKKVYRFEGTVWKEDICKTYIQCAVSYAERVLKAARAELYKCQKEFEWEISRIDAAINTTLNIYSQQLAVREALRLYCSTSEQRFDENDQGTLNTPYGIIDLHDGSIRDCSPDDMRRMCTAVPLPPEELRSSRPEKTLNALREIFLPVGLPDKPDSLAHLDELQKTFEDLVREFDEENGSRRSKRYSSEKELFENICRTKNALNQALAEQRAYDLAYTRWQAGKCLDEMMRFLQVLLGYILIGTNDLQLFLIFLGDRGRNGKGVLCHLIRDILGDYAMEVRSTVFMKGRIRESGAPTPELMAMAKKRCVIASENDRSDQINAPLLKRITGHDWMTGRQLYGSEKSFRPCCVPILESNFVPHFDTQDEALLTRALCLNFDRHFEDNPEEITPYIGQKDPLLEEKLKDEHGLFLNWVVEGAVRYFQEGLQIPDFIEANKHQYRKERDAVEMFLDECCVLDPEKSEASSAVYSAYNQWSKEAGLIAMSAPNFRKNMESKGFAYKKSSSIQVLGIGLTSEAEESLAAYAHRMGYPNN